jgi:hypothetical protein
MTRLSEVAKMFESTVDLFDRLCVKLERANATGFERHLAKEARTRLLQLDHLLQMVRQRDALLADMSRRQYETVERHPEHRIAVLDSEVVVRTETIKLTKVDFEALNSPIFEMQLFTECFYYIAERLRNALRKSKPVRGLESFRCDGARNVRNHLIEHPEGKDSQVFMQGGGMGWTQRSSSESREISWSEDDIPR